MVGYLMVCRTADMLRNLFTEKELRKKLRRAQYELQKFLKKRDYRMAAFRALDEAHIYDLLGDKQESDYYYKAALEYLDNATFQPLWVRLECLIAFRRYEEALNIATTDPHLTKLGLAALHEHIGNSDSAYDLYKELAVKKSKKEESNANFRPHFFQYISDLWEKAQNMERAQFWNEKAVQTWEDIKDTNYDSLIPIEEAWLYEEIGYIYQKADQLETAMDYYQKAKTKYREAYIGDPTATGAHQVDGDWDTYAQWFHLQLPELDIIDFGFERLWKFDSKRIKYRMLVLQKKIRSGNDFR
jgi:tetratricopeptide (TPR) repeat protein